MTPEETTQMNELCVKLQSEKDPQVFDKLVHQLNELLANKERRIRDEYHLAPFVRRCKP